MIMFSVYEYITRHNRLKKTVDNAMGISVE